ncbi:MAG: dTMP kinase [Acidimicrobiia bacterium]|nr:dTMP kinase [Acidimicrobiia bacterium]
MTVRYVAVEGVDGAGKTTVARRVVEALGATGDVRFVREPGGTPTGEAIRDVLLDRDGVVAPWTEALLFAAGRAQLAAEVVGPALEAGALVVSDRTVYSSLAYQGGARGLGLGTVRAVNEAGLQGVWPDLVVLLRVDPAEALAREDDADRISVEGLELQRRVADAYEALARAEPDRFVIVDARRPIDDVVDLVVRSIEERR